MWPRLASRGKGKNTTEIRAGEHASMWPRLASRGKLIVWRENRTVELASMWPRLASRGKQSARHAAHGCQIASMWPRLISRGKEPTHSQKTIASETTLQCGRGSPAAERPVDRCGGTSDEGGFNVAAAREPRKKCAR